MNLKFAASLSLILFGTINAKVPIVPQQKTSTKIRTKTNTKHALSIRGGAGPLNPSTTAKIFLSTSALQGIYDYLAPNKSLAVYGIVADKLSTLCTGVGGGILLMWIITAYGVLFTDMTTLQSIGWAQIPLVVSNLRNILNGDAKETGCSMVGQGINLAITACVAYGCLTGKDYTTLAVKVLSIYMGLANVQCRLFPDSALKSWGLENENKRTPTALFATKVLGHHGIVAAVSMSLLVYNVDPYKALGYSQIPGLLSFVLFITSGDFNTLGFKAETSYPWIALVALTVLTLAF